MIRYTLTSFQPETTDKKEQAQRKSAAAAVLRRLDKEQDESEEEEDDAPSGIGKRQRPRKEDLILTEYEQMIAMEVVAPEDIPVAFDGTIFSLSAKILHTDMSCMHRHWWFERHH